ncbi:MAG: GNAT family N-acetyltransferase [Desulfobacterales bacterium]|jgi:ribosomal protein S18 acetylase RimI-like enzyme|nr:GNAT family N-acetyltransferase [Desulfobacterales bacterium]
MIFRYEIFSQDPENIRRLAESTGFFYPYEVDIAVELAEDRLSHGAESGYHFIMAEQDDRLAGYACFGPIPCTVASYDLYWIAVDPDFQGKGLGRDLMNQAEQRIAAAGGTRVYVDTSERPQYDPTRAFYEKCGYRLEAVLKDFYASGDGKAIYCKPLSFFTQNASDDFSQLRHI